MEKGPDQFRGFFVAYLKLELHVSLIVPFKGNGSFRQQGNRPLHPATT